MPAHDISLSDLFKAHILDVHLPNILVGISASVEVPLITIVGRRIHAAPSQIANFVLLSAVCRTALDLPFGIVVEYVGVRNVMVGCLVLNALAALAGTRIADFATMSVYCVLSGISLGGFFLSRHIFVAGVSSKKYRGMLMSFLSGLLRWSHVVGPMCTGLIIARTGEPRNAFLVAALCALLALGTLLFSGCSPAYTEQCAHSCTTSCRTSPRTTPLQSDSEGEGGSTAASSASSTAPAAAAGAGAMAGSATNRNNSSSVGGVATQPHIVGDENRPLVPALAGMRSSETTFLQKQPQERVHPSMGADEEHFFRLGALWYTMIDYWPVIWRLGLYIVFFGALRSNRKLMIMFAGLREELSDSQVSYLLSFGFVFDALLFPLGGIIMDFMGRQFAMAPVAVGLGLCFFLLPFCHTHTALYAASSAFGIADAMGCGVVMTLTADRAPKVYSAPFFGIMRTLADLGHVVGAGGVSVLVDWLGHDKTCLVLGVTGLLTAAWGVLGVPRDTEPLETPRLDRAAARHDRGRRRQLPAQRRRELGEGVAVDGEERRPLMLDADRRRGGAASHSYGAV